MEYWGVSNSPGTRSYPMNQTAEKPGRSVDFSCIKPLQMDVHRLHGCCSDCIHFFWSLFESHMVM